MTEPSPHDLSHILRNAASGPKSAEVDGQKVEQHPLSDLMKLDAYLAKKEALKGRTSPLKITLMKHAGA